MTEPAWRYVYTSVRGTAHLDNGSPCQDASLVRLAKNNVDQPLLLLAASDGAGSAARAEEGSRLVCDEALKQLEYRFIDAAARPEQKLGQEIVAHTRNLLLNRADELGCELRELACTLSVAVVLPEWAWFLQVGDGTIVVQERQEGKTPAEFEVVFWPDNGEYANQTYFVTDVPDAHILAKYWERPVDRVGIITDGLQTLALVLAEKRAHPPFFLPMFGTVEAATELGGEAYRVLEPSLSHFLDSQPINSRTNDDKTLILASRIERTFSVVETAPQAAEGDATPALAEVPMEIEEVADSS